MKAFTDDFVKIRKFSKFWNSVSQPIAGANLCNYCSTEIKRANGFNLKRLSSKVTEPEIKHTLGTGVFYVKYFQQIPNHI